MSVGEAVCLGIGLRPFVHRVDFVIARQAEGAITPRDELCLAAKAPAVDHHVFPMLGIRTNIVHWFWIHRGTSGPGSEATCTERSPFQTLPGECTGYVYVWDCATDASAGWRLLAVDLAFDADGDFGLLHVSSYGKLRRNLE